MASSRALRIKSLTMTPSYRSLLFANGGPDNQNCSRCRSCLRRLARSSRYHERSTDRICRVRQAPPWLSERGGTKPEGAGDLKDDAISYPSAHTWKTDGATLGEEIRNTMLVPPQCYRHVRSRKPQVLRNGYSRSKQNNTCNNLQIVGVIGAFL